MIEDYDPSILMSDELAVIQEGNSWALLGQLHQGGNGHLDQENWQSRDIGFDPISMSSTA